MQEKRVESAQAVGNCKRGQTQEKNGLSRIEKLGGKHLAKAE